jgi:hypothetical protein
VARWLGRGSGADGVDEEVVLELEGGRLGGGALVAADTGVGDDDVEVGGVVTGFEGFNGAFGGNFGAAFEYDGDEGVGLVGWQRWQCPWCFC